MNIFGRQDFAHRLSLANKSNLLGLDIGTQYTGIAIAKNIFDNPSPKPLKTLPTSPFDSFVKSLREIVLKEEIGGMVIGWPMSDLDKNSFQPYLKQQILKLSSSFPQTLFLLQDESHSSMEATSMLYGLDKSLSTKKYLVDQVAACIILSRFLTWLEIH